MFRWVYFVVAALCCAGPSAYGQSADSGVGEVSGFAGLVSGLGTHPAGGAGFGVATSRRLMFLGEVEAAPFKDRPVTPGGGRGELRTRLYSFSAMAHIRFPISEYLAPYVIAGVGLLHLTSQLNEDLPGGPLRSHYSDNSVGFVTGAGFRYYLGKHWGLRPEVKVLAGKHVLGGFSAGIFYQFP